MSKGITEANYKSQANKGEPDVWVNKFIVEPNYKGGPEGKIDYKQHSTGEGGQKEPFKVHFQHPGRKRDKDSGKTDQLSKKDCFGTVSFDIGL